MKKLLTRAQILAADDLEVVIVDVPEWGGSVKLRALNGVNREKYDRSMVSDDLETPATQNFKTKLVALSIIDDDNEPLFSMDDVAALSVKSSRALDRVFAVADKLSRVTVDALEAETKN